MLERSKGKSKDRRYYKKGEFEEELEKNKKLKEKFNNFLEKIKLDLE